MDHRSSFDQDEVMLPVKFPTYRNARSHHERVEKGTCFQLEDYITPIIRQT
ncbi:Octanoyltransferase [Frankliniella fusca]|uniref:Octanoyltransferase n=1 Tax=Frankliniella fusca TaxID=407009 RepID=A0AAE1LMV4_9NEOP|nr:Octanoyltransferase [Frankliniella fusca]